MRNWLYLIAALAIIAQPAQALVIEKVVSPGGIEAWLVQDHLNPIIDLEVTFAGGSSQDPVAKLGLASLTAALLDEGAGPLKSQAFQAKLDDLAIEVSFESGKDNFRGHLKTLTPNLDTAIDLFKLSLTQPRFDAEAVDRIKAQTLEELTHAAQDPNAISADQWFKRMFPNHPYGRPADGEVKTVKSITKADMQNFITQHLTRDVLVVGVTGDITPEQLAPLLDRVFGGLKPKQQVAAVPEVEPSPTVGLVVIPQNIPQSVAIFGVQGIKRDDPDWFPALVMNYILGGGGFASWLTEEVREKRGLAYSVYTQLEPLHHTGLLVGGVATRNEKLAQSLDIIKQQWTRMKEQGPSDQELADAKTFLNGSFPLQLDSTAQVASLLVQLQRDHLGLDYLAHRSEKINAVSQDDIKRIANRLLNTDALGIVVVGQPKDLSNAHQP